MTEETTPVIIDAGDSVSTVEGSVTPPSDFQNAKPKVIPVEVKVVVNIHGAFSAGGDDGDTETGDGDSKPGLGPRR